MEVPVILPQHMDVFCALMVFGPRLLLAVVVHNGVSAGNVFSAHAGMSMVSNTQRVFSDNCHVPGWT